MTPTLQNVVFALRHQAATRNLPFAEQFVVARLLARVEEAADIAADAQRLADNANARVTEALHEAIGILERSR